MIDQIRTDIATTPEWILYALAGFALLSFLLFVWRRAARLAEAQAALAEVESRNRSLSEELTLLTQERSDLRADLAAFEALAPRHEQTARELAAAREALSARTAEIARLNETLRQQKQASAEKEALLQANGEALKAEFKTLAAQVLRTHGEDFEKTNAARLQQVLQPLKEHIGRFETELRGVHEAAGKDRAALKAEILNLTRKSMQVSEEAHNLTKALKGDSQKQGAWGEMILASILDRSGLREGEEYETQAHYRNEDGANLRPDVIVNLPGGRKLVIDSKVSLVAYERAVNAENEMAAQTAMQAHVKSVKAHIDELAAKKYHQLDDGAVEYVIMFMPIESAFSEAVRANPDLALYATEKNILIASPTNLMLALKTVENLWSVEKRNKNALEIAKRAGLLYDKFHGFVEDMGKIGTQLERAQASHSAAMGKLTQGRGNLVSQAQTLKTLGARAAKQLAVDYEENTAEIPDMDDSSPS